MGNMGKNEIIIFELIKTSMELILMGLLVLLLYIFKSFCQIKFKEIEMMKRNILRRNYE